MKPKILFTSPCGPYAKFPVDKDPIDYFYYRNTLKQKMFMLRSFQSWHSLHFMAQNIAIDSVVLENPSFDTFKKELRKCEYSIVAIGFTMLLTNRVLEMAQWIKQNFPSTEIVLGGYGTAVFKESFATSDKLKSIADHICYGEGVSFMNSLILKKWNIENHIVLTQDLIPSKNSFFRTHIELFKQIILVGGLGCTYGCSFCATSSQFNRHYIPLFQGKQLFLSLEEQCKKHPKLHSAIIYEEDFLLNRSQVLEFRAYFMNSELHKSLLLTVFASIMSILKYSIEELIECGIGTIFIGVESLSSDVLLKEGLHKRKGEIESLFMKLHSHGINTLGSLIIGWDSQTTEIATSDSSQFIALNPTFYQVVPLHVVPGTRLWEEMKLENRISSDYNTETDGIADFNFEERIFAHAEAQKIISSTYSGLVTEGGPWPFRLFENLINGYTNLNSKKDPILTKRAELYKKMLFPVCLLAVASRLFFYGKNFGKRWTKSMMQFLKHFPLLFGLSIVLFPIVVTLLYGIHIFANLIYLVNPKGDQPDYLRKEYRPFSN